MITKVDFVCFAEAEALHKHKDVWNKAKDHYLNRIIDVYMNRVPATDLASLSDSDFKKFQSSLENYVNEDQISVPTKLELECQSIEKSKIIHCPISTANCGSLDGNLIVLEELCKILQLPSIAYHDGKDVLIFNPSSSSFDLKKVSKDRPGVYECDSHNIMYTYSLNGFKLYISKLVQFNLK